MSKFIVLLIACCSLVACKSSKQISNHEVKATLVDNTGLDGCGWMLQLQKADSNGNSNLIPLNLNAFAIELKNGKQVMLTYEEESKVNTCMAGITVKILTLH